MDNVPYPELTDPAVREWIARRLFSVPALPSAADDSKPLRKIGKHLASRWLQRLLRGRRGKHG